MKEDVGMLKPQKHANKVENIEPKITSTRLHHYKAKYKLMYGYMELVCLILGPMLASQPCLHAFWVLTSLHLLSF